MATGGHGMDAGHCKRLDNWLKTLRASNLVLEFDPSHGFAYQDRVTEDDDLLIRVNEHTTLTDEGALIWCWPPHLSDSEPVVPFSYVVIDVSELSRGHEIYQYALAHDLTIDEAIMRLVNAGLDNAQESLELGGV